MLSHLTFDSVISHSDSEDIVRPGGSGAVRRRVVRRIIHSEEEHSDGNSGHGLDFSSFTVLDTNDLTKKKIATNL